MTQRLTVQALVYAKMGQQKLWEEVTVKQITSALEAAVAVHQPNCYYFVLSTCIVAAGN